MQATDGRSLEYRKLRKLEIIIWMDRCLLMNVCGTPRPVVNLWKIAHVGMRAMTFKLDLSSEEALYPGLFS